MFGWIKRQVARFWNLTTTVRDPANWLIDWVRGGGESDSGIRIDARKAAEYPPVWYALGKISGHMIQMPPLPMKRKDRGAENDMQHAAYRLLKTRSNPYQSAAQFLETLFVHALLWGNGKAAIIRRNRRLAELLLIPPTRSCTLYIEGEKWHLVHLHEDDRLNAVGGTDGGVNDKEPGWYSIPDSDVLHLPGLGFDGAKGLEVFEIGGNSIGLGLAAEKATSKDFANGSKPGVLVEVPKGELRDPKDAKEWIVNFNKYHQGLDNKGRAGLLREGMKATVLPTSNEASQWIESRRFQRQEIALLFMLESILGDDSSVSYNSLEQKMLAYLMNSLMRWVIKIEQECDEKLLTPRQKSQNTHFFKCNTAKLLRADFKTTIESLSAAITARIMSPNEAREKIDMNPYDGGDDYANPAITPGPPGSPEDGAAATDPEEINRAAIAAQMQHMIGVECRRVVSAAKTNSNYLQWLEKFYERWATTLGKSIDKFGGHSDIAQAHCEQSFRELLQLTGTVPQEGLADAVAECVESWPERAEQLTVDIVFGGEHATV